MKKIVLIFLISSLIFSCSKNKMGVPADLSHVENIIVSGEWAVVKSPYTAFRKEPFLQSKILEHSRRGDIFHVTGKVLQKNGDNSQQIWYQFEQGWLLETDISIYSNKLQAEYAASQY